jgi:cytochrome c oxidase subunit III
MSTSKALSATRAAAGDTEKKAVRRRETTPGSTAAIRRGDALDVAHLPSYGFGTRSLMWWGTAGMSTIEGMGFALMIAVYFDLKSRSQLWPNEGTPPQLLWGTLNLVLAIISAVPNIFADAAAKDRDLGRVRFWMIVFLVIGLALLGLRWLELTALNVRWDASAYGSAVWVLFGLHTFNVITNYADSLVVTAVMFKTPVDGKRYVDIAENAGYWWFIVLSWIPIYAVVYWAPRF